MIEHNDSPLHVFEKAKEAKAKVHMQVHEVATNVATKVEKFMSVEIYKEHLKETGTLKDFHKLGHE